MERSKEETEHILENYKGRIEMLSGQIEELKRQLEECAKKEKEHRMQMNKLEAFITELKDQIIVLRG